MALVECPQQLLELAAARIAIELDAGIFNDMFDLPDTPPLPEARFSDIAVPRLGIEWLAARAGGR